MAEEIISTFADQLGSELVDVIAGKEGKMFTVHRDPLFAKCDYLRNILVPATNGKRSYIDFKAEETGAVSLLMNFVYRASVPTSDEYIKAKANPSSSFSSTKFSVFRPSRPIFGHSMSETRLPPFGKLSAQPLPSSPPRFGVPQAPKPSASISALTRTITRVPNTPQEDAIKEHYQVTLLHLCILAERIPWPALFNTAIRSYSQGETTVGRSTPIEHARLIYGKSAETSTLREMILDGMYNLGDDGLELCMAFASEDKNFFKALCKSRLRPKQEFDSLIEALNDGTYDMVEKEPIAFGAGVPHGGVVAPGKSIFDRSSGFTSSVDLTEMKE